MNKNRYVILLTASLNPNGMPFTALQDVTEREKQYLNAIDFYLLHTNYNIVFVNNSGEDIRSKVGDCKGRIEYLSFNGNDFDRKLGKGYGEFMILQYAFQHSKFIQQSQYIIKITGRLIVENISKVILLNDVILCCPKNKIYGIKNDDTCIIDSRCFVASKEFFVDLFLAKGNLINDTNGYYFEHLLYNVIFQNKERLFVSNFCLPLMVLGISGSKGVKYEPEHLSFYKKLTYIREFCEYNKRELKRCMSMRYYWVSLTSLLVRIGKSGLRKMQ